MNFFHTLFSKKRKATSTINDETEEHCVIIYFDYGKETLSELHKLCSDLRGIILSKKLGEFDGHEIAMDLSDGSLYMYGPNAEALFIGVKPLLEQIDFMIGARAKLRFGPPEDGVKEIIVEI